MIGVTHNDEMPASSAATLLREPNPTPERDLEGNQPRRWPRQRLLRVLLTGVLVVVYAPLLVLGTGTSFTRPLVLVIAFGLAITVRLLYDAPLPARLRPHRHADVWAAGRAATVACALGWLAVTALGERHFPLRLLARWVLPALILLSAKPLRRAETRLGIGRTVFFVGAGTKLEELRREITRSSYLELTGVARPQDVIGSEELLGAFTASRATVLVLSDEAIRSEAVVEAAVRVNLEGFRVRDLRSFYEQEFDKVPVSDLSLSWFLFDIAAIHKRHLYGSIKRCLETIVAAVVLVLTAPLVPLIAAGIWLSSPGPILFRQARVGRSGEAFTLTKFRTMHRRHGAEHGLWAGACADRLFPVGRFLRRSRLDELPQLVAVVRGKLSLVGPRPEQPEIARRLEQTMPYYPARHVIRPGLTGWAQVNMGYGGSDAGSLTKLQYDLFYIKRQSLSLDLRIMASTARSILFGSAY